MLDLMLQGSHDMVFNVEVEATGGEAVHFEHLGHDRSGEPPPSEQAERSGDSPDGSLRSFPQEAKSY